MSIKNWRRDNERFRLNSIAKDRVWRSTHVKERAAYAKKEHQRNASEYRLRERNRRQKLRLAALKAYSVEETPTCICCHTSLIVFLNIDHIFGHGNEHRRSIGVSAGTDFFKWLAENDYPEGFQILCCNCNHAKHVLGRCPCQDPPDILSEPIA